MSKQQTKSKRGRPTKYTQAIGEVICQRIVKGDSLRTIAKSPKMPGLSTIAAWIVDDKHTEFQERYARARKAQAELLADDLADICDDARNDWMEKHNQDGESIGYTLNSEAVQRSKLRVDTRKWIASRLLHRYADKQRHEHTGPEGKAMPIQLVIEPVASNSDNS